MSEFSIKVDKLSKLYRLGQRQKGYRTLRESIEGWAKKPLRRFLGRNRNGAAAAVPEATHCWAIRDVSFEVGHGEVWGIIGRNGAGKSTLLKILSRITEPTEGSAEIVGRVGSLLEVGTGFHPELTGRENIFLSGAILGMKREEIKRKFDAIVAFSEIEKFIDTPVKRYSSGMYVRLAFAVASHLDPEILLVDEVLAVGDARFQKKCLAKLQGDATDGKTALIVSHNMHVIRNLCHKAVLLEQGRVELVGSADEIVTRYIEAGNINPAVITWPDNEAPGTAKMRLLRACVLDAEGEPATVVEIDKEVGIELVYDVLQDLPRGYAGLWLKDRLGVVVFVSQNAPYQTTTPDEFCGQPMPKGRYRSVCRIPGDLLNSGHYLVTPILGADLTKTQVLLQDLLEFEVADTSEMRKEFQGTFLGVVRPKLAWSTQRLS